MRTTGDKYAMLYLHYYFHLVGCTTGLVCRGCAFKIGNKSWLVMALNFAAMASPGRPQVNHRLLLSLKIRLMGLLSCGELAVVQILAMLGKLC